MTIMMKVPKLTIELVPSTAWFGSLKKTLTKEEWNKVRYIVYEKAGKKCEICGGIGPKWPVECHEVWQYDESAKVQKFIRGIALCPYCHEVKHIGRARMMDRGEEALAHLAKVNGWTTKEAEKYTDKQFDVWRERSRHEWTLDLSELKKYGVTSQPDIIKPKDRIYAEEK